MSVPDSPDNDDEIHITWSLVDPHVLTDAESTISAAALLVHIIQWQVVGLRNSRFLLYRLKYILYVTHLAKVKVNNMKKNAKLIM